MDIVLLWHGRLKRTLRLSNGVLDKETGQKKYLLLRAHSIRLINAHCLMDAHSCIPDSQLPERRCFQALHDSLVRRQCLVMVFSSTSVISISLCV